MQRFLPALTACALALLIWPSVGWAQVDAYVLQEWDDRANAVDIHCTKARAQTAEIFASAMMYIRGEQDDYVTQAEISSLVSSINTRMRLCDSYFQQLEPPPRSREPGLAQFALKLRAKYELIETSRGEFGERFTAVQTAAERVLEQGALLENALISAFVDYVAWELNLDNRPIETELATFTNPDAYFYDRSAQRTLNNAVIATIKMLRDQFTKATSNQGLSAQAESVRATLDKMEEELANGRAALAQELEQVAEGTWDPDLSELDKPRVQEALTIHETTFGLYEAVAEEIGKILDSVTSGAPSSDPAQQFFVLVAIVGRASEYQAMAQTRQTRLMMGF